MANAGDNMEGKFFDSMTGYIKGLIVPVIKENEVIKSELEKTKNSLIEVSTNYLNLQTKVDNQYKHLCSSSKEFYNDCNLAIKVLQKKTKEELNTFLWRSHSVKNFLEGNWGFKKGDRWFESPTQRRP